MPDTDGRYTAEWHLPGCLPDTDVLDWDTPREAWNDLIERLTDSDLMWERRIIDGTPTLAPSLLALALAFLAEQDEPGAIQGPDGYIYCVEDTLTGGLAEACTGQWTDRANGCR